MTTHKLKFPQDHRFHTGDNASVYFSGAVETSAGREFGIMFTIFQFPGFGDSFAYPSMEGTPVRHEASRCFSEHPEQMIEWYDAHS